MGATRQRWHLAGLVAAAVVLTAGCNLLSLPYFLFAGPDLRPPQFMKLASSDKDKEVKVVILAHSGVETRPEFLLVDHELADKLARCLQQGCKENKEKVKVVPPRDVRDFKNKHSGWWEDLEAVGKHFGVDYVIYLEISSMTLYERGQNNTLFHGRADIAVQVLDMNAAGFAPQERDFTCEYPGQAKGPIPVEDISAEQFRQKFLDQAARRLSWYFTAHPVDQEIACE